MQVKGGLEAPLPIASSKSGTKEKPREKAGARHAQQICNFLFLLRNTSRMGDRIGPLAADATRQCSPSLSNLFPFVRIPDHPLSRVTRLRRYIGRRNRGFSAPGACDSICHPGRRRAGCASPGLRPRTTPARHTPAGSIPAPACRSRGWVCRFDSARGRSGKTCGSLRARRRPLGASSEVALKKRITEPWSRIKRFFSP